MNNFLIVTRHPAAVEFIKNALPEFVDAPVLASATPADVLGRVVAGNVPLYLAALAEAVIVIEFAGDAPRGAEYSLDDMIAAGARLQSYIVIED